MNEPGEIPLTNSDTPDTKPCSLISIIPNIGMSSCRGRAEAFARRLSSKLRTLGSQTDDEKDLPEDEPIINGLTKNTWMPSGETDMVTELQPGRHESDSFFDYDCDLESPGSPVDECEYLRLIETASNTPHNSAAESGYACGSATSSHSSNDGHCPNSNVNFSNDTTDDNNAASSLPQSLMNSINITDYSKYVNVLKPKNFENQINNEFNNKTLTSANIKDGQRSLETDEEIDLNDIKHSLENNLLKDDSPIDAPTKGSDIGTGSESESGIISETENETQIKYTNHLNSNNNNNNNNNNNINSNDNDNDVKLTTKQTFPFTNSKPYYFKKDEDMVKIQNDILQELQSHSAIVNDDAKVVESQQIEEETVDNIVEEIENGEKEDVHVEMEMENEMEVEVEVETETETEVQLEVEEKEIKIEEIPVENGEETLLIRDDQNHTYTFHQSITNGQQIVEREEVLKIEVTTEEKIPTNGIEPLKIDIAQVQENNLLLITTIQRDETSPQCDDSNDKENLIKKKANGSRNSNNQVNEITDDEEDCRPQRVRRCSSLKTGKTPPGTPGRKKIVRFADVLGLDLADVKTFLDEIPTIPKSAFMDLEIMESEPPLQLGPRSDKLLMPLFQQPGGLPTFLDIVREKQVSLENASVTDVLNQTITGTVRVRNLDFHKSVYIRYTLDNWRSFADLQANYVPNSCDGFSDKFSFIIFGNSLQIGQRLELAVRFQCKGHQFWDNNYGTNYCFQCLASGNPLATTVTSFVPATHPVSNVVGLLSPTAGDAWCHSFY